MQGRILSNRLAVRWAANSLKISGGFLEESCKIKPCECVTCKVKPCECVSCKIKSCKRNPCKIKSCKRNPCKIKSCKRNPCNVLALQTQALQTHRPSNACPSNTTLAPTLQGSRSANVIPAKSYHPCNSHTRLTATMSMTLFRTVTSEKVLIIVIVFTIDILVT